MFEKLAERAAILAARRVRVRSAELAERLRDQLPRGIGAVADDQGVRLSGRDLLRRAALDPALRALLAGLK